jgi:hypothetical protein
VGDSICYKSVHSGYINKLLTDKSTDISLPSRSITLQTIIPFLCLSSKLESFFIPRPLRRRLKNRKKRDIFSYCSSHLHSDYIEKISSCFIELNLATSSIYTTTERDKKLIHRIFTNSAYFEILQVVQLNYVIT